MIIDWREMRPHIPGEAEDAAGFKMTKELDYTSGRTPFRIDTVTGRVDCYVWPYETDENGELRTVTLQLVPPITVWLYT